MDDSETRADVEAVPVSTPESGQDEDAVGEDDFDSGGGGEEKLPTAPTEDVPR